MGRRGRGTRGVREGGGGRRTGGLRLLSLVAMESRKCKNNFVFGRRDRICVPSAIVVATARRVEGHCDQVDFVVAQRRVPTRRTQQIEATGEVAAGAWMKHAGATRKRGERG